MRQHTDLIRKLAFPIMSVLLPGLLQAQAGIRISNGANLIMSGGVDLVLNNAGFVNNGNFAAGNSTVIFIGNNSGGAARVSGTSSSSFKNVFINKSSGDVNLEQSVNIGGTITMIRGNVQLNGNVLNLGTTGSIASESDQSHITGAGNVFATRSFTPNVAINPGNIGAELLIPNPTLTNTISVARNHSTGTLFSGNESIQRNFTISAPDSGPSNYTLRFFYLDGELNSNDESLLNLYSIITDPPIVIGRDGNDINANFVSKIGLQLGSFTLASEVGGPAGRPGSINTSVRAAERGLERISMHVFPNPSRNMFRVALTTNAEKNIAIKLIDQTGHVLQQKKIHCYQGSNIIPWNMSSYAAGVYFIIVENTGLRNIRIVKE